MCNVLVDTTAIVYVNDLIVRGRTQAEHNLNLGEVLGKLKRAGMHIKREKMQLSRKHVLFLGSDVCEGAFSLDSYVEMQKKRLPFVSSRGEIKKNIGHIQPL